MSSDHNITGDSMQALTPRFSVIMPVHDAESFLDAAITVIEHQTFDDWELVVVDDASQDASAAIARRHAAADSRIRVIAHEQNAGAAAARNTGMDAARGNYIWFVDADDSFDANVLEQVDVEITRSDAQIVMFGRVEEYLAPDHSLQYCNDIPMEPFASKDPAAWHPRIIDIERQTNFGYVTSKVYETAFLRDQGVRFKDILLNEDFVFNVQAFRNAERVAAIAGVPYVYRKIEGGSVTNANAYSPEEYYALHRLRIEMMRDLLEGWGVFDERERAILGSLYGRYILSMIERLCAQGSSDDVLRAWLECLFDDDLFNDLIPHAQAGESKYLEVSLAILKSKDIKKAMKLGKGINFVKKHFYSFFTKARSGR